MRDPRAAISEGGTRMFRPSRIAGVLVIALALTGCAQKSEHAANDTASDSLLAANPVEPPQSGITPQKEYQDRKSTRLNSSHLVISYAVFCLKKKLSRSGHDLSNRF